MATVTAAAWVGSLGAVFVFDDYHSVVNNPELRDPANIPRYFVDPSFFSIYTMNAYRPLTLVSYTITFALFGDSSTAMHAGNLLLHVGCTVVLYGLFCVLLGPLEPARAPLAAALGAVAFGVHPGVGQVVHYVSSRAESLAFLAIASALLCHAAGNVARSGVGRRLLRVASALAVALALASKETGILVLPLLVALDLAQDRQAGFSRRVGRLAPAIALVGVYFALRFGDEVGRNIVKATSTPVGGEPGQAAPIVEALRALLVYWRLSLLPAGLAMVRELPPSANPIPPALLAGSLLACGLAMSTRWLLRTGGQRLLGLAGLLYLLPLMPYLVRSGRLMVNENRLYVPLSGLALAAAVAGAWLLGRSRSVAARRALAGVAGGLLVAALVADGVISRRWSSEERIWRQAIAVSPHAGDIRGGLGASFMRRQQWAEARQQFKEALRYRLVQRYVVYDNLGIASYWLGERSEALSYFELARREAPDSIEVLNNLGSLLRELGRPSEALPHLDRAAEIAPAYCEPRIEAISVMRDLNRSPAAGRRLDALPPHCRADPRIGELRRWANGGIP